MFGLVASMQVDKLILCTGWRLSIDMCLGISVNSAGFQAGLLAAEDTQPGRIFTQDHCKWPKVKTGHHRRCR